MSELIRVRMKVNDIVGGGVYFIGEELFTTPENADLLVKSGKAEMVPARGVSVETGFDTPLNTTATQPPSLDTAAPTRPPRRTKKDEE